MFHLSSSGETLSVVSKTKGESLHCHVHSVQLNQALHTDIFHRRCFESCCLCDWSTQTVKRRNFAIIVSPRQCVFFLWWQCKIWVRFFYSNLKIGYSKPPTIIFTALGESDNSWGRKPRTRLYMRKISYMPENLINILWRVQNTTPRLVFNMRKDDCIIPALVTLDWQSYQIGFIALFIVFKGLQGKAHRYTQNDHPIKKQKTFHKGQWSACP